MSAPQTIHEYMRALGALLEVGLRSRRRIMLEVYDHLCQAADKHLRRDETEQEAQRRAIAAFGSPAEVAARFEAGLIGALDRRLALSAQWVYRWTAGRPSGIAVMWMALGLALAGVLAAVGALFGASSPFAGARILGLMGVVWGLMYIVVPSWRRRVQAGRTDWKVDSTFLLTFPTSQAYLTMVGTDPGGWSGLLALLVILATYGLAEAVINVAVSRAAWRYAQATEEDGRRSWSANHPWRAALSHVAALPLGLIALIVVFSGPVDLRVALVVLVAAMTAVTVAAMRLEQARREKAAYQHALMSKST